MNNQQVTQIIEMIPNRSKPNDAEMIVYQEILEPLDYGDAIEVMMHLIRTVDWITPKVVEESMVGGGYALAWAQVSAMLAAGKFSQRLDPEAFSSYRAYSAARAISNRLRTGTLEQNSRAFKASWEQTAETPGGDVAGAVQALGPAIDPALLEYKLDTSGA